MKFKVMVIFALFVLASLVSGCSSQRTSEGQDIDPKLSQAIQEHYQAWSFETIDLEDGNFVNYGALIRDGNSGERPLLVFLDGSGHQSAFGLKENGVWIRPGGPFGFGTSLFPEYDLLVPEKINVTVGGDHQNDEAMSQWYTFDGRVASAVKVIDTFLDSTTYDTVYIFGVSEGGVILPQVYQRLESRARVAKLIISGAGGLSQAEEFDILQHYAGLPDPLRLGYEQLGSVIDEIRADPDSIEKEYFGYKFKRWSSFLDYRPLDDLIEIDIPILLIHGTEDISSPVESAQALAEEFDAQGKTNLTYHEYEGMGHNPSNKREQDRMYAALREWLLDN